MAKDFVVVEKFQGYENKRDITNIPRGILVSPSKNVISSDGDRVASRKGFTLFGQEGSGTDAIVSSYEWTTHRGTEIILRAYGDKLQFLSGTTWVDLMTSLTSVNFNFTEYWDNTAKQDLLLFVNGGAVIYEWNGATTTFASATANTLTKEGTTTWFEEGFNATGTVIIDGVTYTYTGGATTTTLTGVTPDPTAATPTAGDLAYQPVATTAAGDMTSEPDFTYDLIATLYNQIYLGSLTSREVYVSKVNNYKNFAFTANRVPGEGALITLDGTVVAFDPQEDYMSIHAGKDQIYQTVFTLSSDNTKESLSVKRLKTSSRKAARSQAAIGKVINDTVFISNEPTLDTLGRVEQINTPQTKPLSDPIKLDFESYSFANVHVRYFKNNIYIALPVEGLVLIRNLEKGWWEAPQVLPVSRFAVIAGELYGHSSSTNETYKLFVGYNDNGNPINAVAAFSYMNFGSRTKLKNFSEWFTEGYITPSTTLTLTMYYEYNGFAQITTHSIEGSDTSLIYDVVEDESLGVSSLGEGSLGGGGGIIEVLPPKFRHIATTTLLDFFEMQVIYSTDAIDQQWEILAFGPEVTQSMAEAVTIKE